MEKMIKYALITAAAVTLIACSTPKATKFTDEELAVINGGIAEGADAPLLRVLTVNDSADLKVLRTHSTDLQPKAVKSEDYKRLAVRMIQTVSDPSVDGVGLAAPQIGINRRIVAVQRFDKDGTPFEVYPNIRIIRRIGVPLDGFEGCLSVPGYRGVVPRYQAVVIEYTSPETLSAVRDTINGFTAVIFQHETDHLDGIVYTDIATRVSQE